MIFCIKIGQSVSGSIVLQGNERPFIDYLGPPSLSSMYIDSVTKCEIDKIIDGIKVNKTYGYDFIHHKLSQLGK